MGQVGFGELAFWLVTQRRPTPGRGARLRGRPRRAGRPRLHADRHRRAADLPERARLAAGRARRRPARRRLALPRRHRGLAAASCRGARGATASTPPDDAGWDALALEVVQRTREDAALRARARAPVHKERDPRTPVLLRIAEQEGLRGPHLRLFEAIGRVHPEVLGPHAAAQRRRRVRRGAGRPRPAARAAARRSRCWRAPPGCSASWPRSAAARSPMDMYLSVDRNAVRAPSPTSRRRQQEEPTWRSWSRSSPRPTTPSTTRRAPHRREEAPPFAAEWVRKIEAFRETLTRARPDVLLMVGSDHFHQLWLDNMPQFLVGHAEQYDANWYNEEREFGLPRMLVQGDRDLSGHVLRERPRRRLRPRVQQRAAHRPQRHLPDHHAAPAERPADRARLHQHLRAAAAAAEAVRAARPDAARAGRVVAERQAGRGHRHRPPVARARRPAPVRPARSRPGVRPPRRRVDLAPATSRAACRR